jgi:leader peptidase (prepilin peptidase)/N-methyltransferase
MPIWIILSCYALVFGLLVGSFLNVVIARLPKDQSIVSPRSHCPKCLKMIGARDNIPIVSWLLLRGSCRTCAHPISSLYPTVELLVGLLSLLLFWRIIPNPQFISWEHGFLFLLQFSFVSMLVAQSFIDIRYYIIPDQLSIYPIPFFIAGIYALGCLDPSITISWKSSFLGAFFGGGSLLFISLIWRFIRKKEGMGMGDIKLLALIGAVLGPWPALPMIIFLSSISALLVIIPMSLMKKRSLRHALPFGPFLALGSIIWLLHGRELMRLWLPGADGIFLNL